MHCFGGLGIPESGTMQVRSLSVECLSFCTNEFQHHHTTKSDLLKKPRIFLYSGFEKNILKLSLPVVIPGICLLQSTPVQPSSQTHSISWEVEYLTTKLANQFQIYFQK